jgi:hypothetical protein
MSFGRDVELTFKGKADFSQARAEVSGFRGILQKEVQGIAGDFAGAAGGAGRFAASLGPVGLAIGAVAGIATIGAGAFVAMTARGVELGSRLNDLSLQTGLTVETLSGLSGQLKESGTSADALGNAVLFMHKNLGQAAEGNKELKRTFAELGIEDVDAALQDTDGSLRTIIKSLGELTTEGERDRLGTEALGRGYKELRVFIADTGGDIDEVMRKAQEAGLVMSGEVAGNLDALGDAWDRLDHKTQVMGANFSGTVAPELTKALDDISAALGSNLGNWDTWAQGAAMSIARVRGGMEGAAKWMHGNTWSPWELGKQIEMGSDAAGTSMMVDLIYNKYKAQPPTHAPRGGGIARGGGGGGGGGKKKADDSKLKGFEADDKDLETDFRRESDALARDYKNRLDTLAEFTSSELALLDVWIKEKRRIFDAEEAEVTRSVKNEKEREQKLREIQSKRVAASDEYDRKRNAAEDNLAEETRRAAQAKAEGLAKIEDANNRRSIASIEARVDFGIKKESEGAKEIGDLQLEMHDRAVGLLKDRLEKEDKGGAEYQRIQKQIGASEVERAALVEATAHRVEVATKRELDALRQLRDELLDIELEIRSMEIDAAERENRFPTRGDKLSIIASRAAAETDAENARHERVMKRLDRMRKEGQDEKTIHELEEAEGRRHNLEMGKIGDAEGEGKRKLDPLGGLKDMWDQLKADAKDTTGSVNNLIGGLANEAVDVVGTMTSALQQGIEANILYGESIGLAFKKALAAQLAHFAAEADIQALREFALSLASLAMGNFTAAGLHAATGAAWLAVGLAAGKGAGALAKSAGLKGGAGTGATAGQAVEASSPRNQNFKYNEGTESASGSQRDGSRGGFWDRLDRTHQQWLDLARQQTMGQTYTVQAIKENTAALSTFTTASAGDVVERGHDERPHLAMETFLRSHSAAPTEFTDRVLKPLGF